MNKWTEIRRRVLVDGQSKRSVCQEFDIHWDTLIKILGHSEPPGYRQGRPRHKPKIGPFLEVIEEILRHDQTVHRKQRHTKRRIFERLQEEYGYTGGHTAVKEAVCKWELRHREAFMPLRTFHENALSLNRLQPLEIRAINLYDKKADALAIRPARLRLTSARPGSSAMAMRSLLPCS